jgi:hypothetical protein
MGAELRLRELRDEMANIERMFPEVRSGRRQSAAPAAAAPAAAKAGRGRRKKRVFSPAGKAAISEGMRKYWARRKAKMARAKAS